MANRLFRWTARWHCVVCGRWVKPNSISMDTFPEDPRRPLVMGTCSQDGRVRVESKSWWSRR